MSLLRTILDHRISPKNASIRILAVGSASAPPLGYLILTAIEEGDPQRTAPATGAPAHDFSDKDGSLRIWQEPTGHIRVECVVGATIERHVGGPTSTFIQIYGSEELPEHQGVTWDALFAALVDWFAEAVRHRIRPSETNEIAQHLEYARLLQARRYLKRVAAAHPESGSSWLP